VALAALLTPLIACSNGEGGGSWRETGSTLQAYHGVVCRADISGAVRMDAGGDKWTCKKAPGGTWLWYESRFRPNGVSVVDGAAVTTGPGIAAQPGSVFLVVNTAGVSTWQHSLDTGAAPPALRLAVAPDGAVTVDPSSFVTSRERLCQTTESGVEECLGLTIRGTGPISPVTINPIGTVQVPMGFHIEITSLSGFAGLPAGCRLGPISGTLTANNYDPTTGSATLVALDRPLAAAAGCGTYNDLFNGVLGLPGAVDVVMFVNINLR
jgi:hypothetical protein